MKTIILSIALIFGISFSQAQIDTLMVIKKEADRPSATSREKVQVKANDTTVIQFNKKRVIIVDDGEDKHVTWDSNEGNEKKKEKDWDYDSWEDKDKDNDSYRYSDDDDDDNKDGKKRKRQTSEVDAFAMDLGLTNYFSGNVYGREAAPAGMELNDFRVGSHVALHFLPTTVSLVGRGVINLKTALTVDYSNYYFQNDITLVPGQDQLTLETSAVSLDKNKLTARYFQVPMLLNINTSPWTDDGLSISFGVYGGVLWKAHSKQVSKELGTVKDVDDFNLNPIRYGLMARFDLKWMDLYATYNLSEMFEEGRGPSTQTFTVGVNLFDF